VVSPGQLGLTYFESEFARPVGVSVNSGAETRGSLELSDLGHPALP
jgi:hypothetical protein